MEGSTFSTPMLNLLSGERVVARYRFSDKKTLGLGRGESNDVRLKFSWVSRQHAMIQMDSNGICSLVDLGSANGTFINGRRIHAISRLADGDRIGIGQTILVFAQAGAHNPEPEIQDGLEEKTVAFVNKQVVTVLVSDIRNFTRLAEVIGDTRTTRVLQVWNSKVNDIVSNYGGTVDKFIGDAVMALWQGGPDLSYTVGKVLETALAIEQLTGQLQNRMPEIPWSLRTGAAINTGEAVVGNIGGDRHDFTVIGDSVNVVFRLEEMTNQSGFDLLIGDDTARHIKNLHQCFTAQRFFLKGKEQPFLAHGCSFDRLRNFLEGKKG